MSIDLALFPLDTIKTRIQSFGKVAKGTISLKSNNEKILKLSKYSGFKSSMIASFPAAAVFFGTYDYTKYFLKNKLHIKQDYIIHLLSSIIGEASQNLVRNPFELVKQNMQIGKYESMLEAFRKIYSKLGIYVKLINN